MNDYFKQKQLIARVDENGKILGEIEKWETHEKGILHKGFTVALTYNDKFLVQNRRHPAFDGSLDITSSSHQLFIDGQLQTLQDAGYDCLRREWNLDKKDLASELKNTGAVYYKAKDSESIYTEHEVCEILTAEVSKIPEPNPDFAYGFSLASMEELIDKNGDIYKNLAPWVKKMIEENKL